MSLNLKDTVFFMGFIQNAASKFIPYIDIFFLPSLWEAMSVGILEAMAAGKPVVCTDVGENKHVVDNGKSGFIALSGDVKKMSSALETLIQNHH